MRKIDAVKESMRLCKKALGSINISLSRRSSVDKLLLAYEDSLRHKIFKKLNKFAKSKSDKLELIELLDTTESQLYQDLATLLILGFKKEGFFVEPYV